LPKPNKPAVDALMLLGRWTRVTQEGVLLFGSGGGCSCCYGMESVSVGAIEVQMLDFLADRYAKNTGFDALLRDRAGYKSTEQGKVGDLLKAIGGGKTGVTDADLAPVIDDLKAMIESFEVGPMM
jgi:hypothetical protein